MNLFNISLKLNGFPLDKAKRVLSNIQKENEVNIELEINARKKAIVTYHLKHNAFYKSLVKNIDINDWNSLPVITKRDLQQPLANRLSDGFTLKNVFINKTSGSSGNPFIFAKDKFCHALIWSVFIDRYHWFNIDLNSSKQARFYGIPLNSIGYFKERIKDLFSNRFRFSVFNLSNTEFEKNLQKFDKTKFDYINGYTSVIVQFAKFLKEKNIVLKTICPALKACIVTSEMLFNEDKILLENQLGIPVINEYGAAELGLIAFQNTKNEWILNNEDLFVEILDDNNNPLPNGETGRIVITALYNKAHPFIRYDIGDIGALDEKSTLKKPILKSLLGRTSDIVYLPSGKKAAGLTFYYVTKTVIEDSGLVKEFIIEQLKTDTFKISYVSDSILSEEKIAEINETIERYLEPNLKIQFQRKAILNRSKSGKLKQFNSYL